MHTHLILPMIGSDSIEQSIVFWTASGGHRRDELWEKTGVVELKTTYGVGDMVTLRTHRIDWSGFLLAQKFYVHIQ